MKRNIIKIDEEKCNGCGLCVNACHEKAIEIVNGKAKLISDEYCDGLGACLPACPVDAIKIEQREAKDFNEELVKEHICNSSKEVIINNEECCNKLDENNVRNFRLKQWPCQIKLVSPNASFFNNSDLVIAADCTAYAYPKFNREFIKNNTIIIGCPKLDNVDYSEKILDIIVNNNIKSIKLVKMEVPCCYGIQYMLEKAIEKSMKKIPVNIYTVTIDGNIEEERGV